MTWGAQIESMFAAHGRMCVLLERVRLWQEGALDLTEAERDAILEEAAALVLQAGGRSAEATLN